MKVNLTNLNTTAKMALAFYCGKSIINQSSNFSFITLYEGYIKNNILAYNLGE